MATTRFTPTAVVFVPLFAAFLALSGCRTGWQGAPENVEPGGDQSLEDDLVLRPVPPAPPGAVMCPKVVDERPSRKTVSEAGDTLMAGAHVLEIRPGTIPSNGRYPFMFAEPKARYIVVQAGRGRGPLRTRMWITLSTARCTPEEKLPDSITVLRHAGESGDQWGELLMTRLSIQLDSLSGTYSVTFPVTDFSNYALAAPQ